MASEEWEMALSGEVQADTSPYRISECPSCGNRTPQRELAWASCDEVAVGDVGDGEIGYIGAYEAYFHFTQCATCDQPSVYEGVDVYDVTSASLVWPKQESAPPQPSREQRHLAAAAELLTARGQTQASALLLECVGITYRPIDIGFRGEDSVRIVLGVIMMPPLYVDRFEGEMLAEIAGALSEASFPDGIIVKDVTIAPVATTEGDWRDRVERTLGLGPTNQAALLPPRENLPTVDRLTFGSDAERAVYEVAKEKQAELPSTDTLMIAPNPGIRVRGTTLTPDLLITFRGRAGIIEVDGHYHRGRYASDRSRDELFRDAGVVEVYRIPVEDTALPDQIRPHLERFLKRLSER